ncbi:hypothetical protein [Paenibacillus naphthalenovorans]|uniref:hypothetical protein n=1 Tax=Paenibacillus naphthalenovorans TaxID=162209 RepID=UPI0008872B7F|nr:hypothetical protein [Paenibacillus naphthalenovorans]SDJ82669.1 hypothetical protein SAMN05421868_1479 [Paenibacillus naphthalenovorans]
MKINVRQANSALISLIEDFAQIIPVDANFLIPPDRTKEVRGAQAITFQAFRKFWLEPLFVTFPYLAIHEAVYDELVTSSTRTYVKDRIDNGQMILLSDEDLDERESAYRAMIELQIAQHTAYDPEIDNKDDRGEVKSLAHIATKQLLYFCSRDSRALRLLSEPFKNTIGLDSVSAIQAYELIYYMYAMKMTDSKELKAMYKYLYYLSENDRRVNPEWGQFIQAMQSLYQEYVNRSTGKPTPRY